jgi:hypothetical protein
VGSENRNFHKGKPKLNRHSKYTQGFYKPMFPSKYVGDTSNIVYRSGLELKYYKFFDFNPAILEWKCEEIVIPYFNPCDNKIHRYFVDVWIKYKTKKNEIKQAIIEIKPLAQVKRPVEKKNRRTYVQEVNTYITNVAKWEAATEAAENTGMEFKILTESGFLEWKSMK